jgi:hypothetical protein
VVRVMRGLSLVLLSVFGCVTEPVSAPPGSMRACPDGQMDLDVTYANGRRVRECVEFRGTVLSLGCRRHGYGGNSIVATVGDPPIPPRSPRPRVYVENSMHVGEASGIVTVPFGMVFTLDREGECPPGQRYCEFVAFGANPTQVCLVEAVIPAPGERVIAYRLTAPCRAVSWDYSQARPLNDGREMILHRADFRGPLVWVGDFGRRVEELDGGFPYFPDCGTAP